MRSVGLFVVDEAHCISDWGHDFRPGYRRIRRVLDLLPFGVPLLCTTATANDRVVVDVVEQLGQDLHVARGPLDREALHLAVVDIPDPSTHMAWLAQRIPELPGCGIVYCLTVDDAHRLAQWLQRNDIAETGRALNVYADGGWGSVVRQAKYHDHAYPDGLVDATVRVVDSWQPSPPPPTSVWRRIWPSGSSNRRLQCRQRHGAQQVIYALSRATLVVASDHESGGTWAGATESLKQSIAPVLVWTGGGAGPGNRTLVELGGQDLSDVQHILAHASTAELPALEPSQLRLGV